MVKISKIKLANYKSLHDVELELRPLNILIGRNGSGKSNLLDFFRLLKAGAAGQLARHINREGGFTDLHWWGESASDLVSFRLDLDFDERDRRRTSYADNHFENFTYDIGIGQKGNGYILDERIGSNIYNQDVPYNQETRFLWVHDNHIDDLWGYRGAVSPKTRETIESKYNSRELFIQQFNSPTEFATFGMIHTLLNQITVYRGFGSEAINNVHQAQTLDALHPLRLEPDLSNLVSIIHALQNNAQYERAYEDLSDILDSAFPEISKLDTPQSAAGKIELRWRNTHFTGKSLPAMSLSDGMVRFLGLATLLTLPDPPAIIAIDEPEIGLHPKLIPLLAGLLKQASSRTQIVVTTHSPELLNSDDITLDDIVLVNKEDGATTFERPDSERLERWLERYSIGGLWLMGNLEQP